MDHGDSFYAVKTPTEPPGGSDDEDSFVVLGTSSLTEDVTDSCSLNGEVLPPIRSNKIHDMQNLIKMEISQINNSTAIPEMPSVTNTFDTIKPSTGNIALTPDSSYEEIQKLVEELIKENEKLKNIIQQNNLSMKTQYDRILTWKEEVNNVIQSYKVKFGEAKAFIDKYKEENVKLANDVEKYKKIKELQDEEIINLKSKERGMENLGRSSEENLVQFELQIANDKMKDLQIALEEANQKNAEVAKENEKLIEKLVTAPKLEDQLHAKQEEIDKLQAELVTVENREKSLRDHVISLKNEIGDLHEALDKATKENYKATKSISQITSYTEQLQQQEHHIEELTKEKNSLKQEMKSIEATAAKEMVSLKKELQSLQAVHDAALQEKYHHTRQQLMNSQMTITALEQEVKSKVQEIEEIRRLLQSSSKSDEIFALKEQLVLYKSDFEAEKESKRAIKQERDQIAEDLLNLQKRNKQLQNEIENLREQPKQEEYTCPKCSFGFNNYQSLENHVHRCLDLEGFP